MPVDLFPLECGIASLFVACLMYVLCKSDLTARNIKRVKWVGYSILILIWGVYLLEYHSAEIWYGSAAERGDPVAQYKLALCHFGYGRGAEYEPRRARSLLEKAASSGYAPAELALAGRFVLGSSMPQDNEQARKILEKLERDGNQDARKLIECLNECSWDADKLQGDCARLLWRLAN